MEWITSYDAWLEIVKSERPFLLFVKTDNCSVCDGLLPQVTALQTIFTIPFYIVNAAKMPEMAGQLSLFTAPVVLLFAKGKEYTRFARFVPMEELKKRIEELEKWGKEID
ncbi:thioredoxin family protein [Sporosarcina sp. G11-34]|uniref:thioredoxin family protein n=1 Tax=Sporosarcina sp. G11-34 TaxID=2849605 RepID=UPI0022A9CC9C|nr:thioredoxin family protein [Sporosarcina sp. G11-34]MCZ2258173.1 thioredoxin family protein [Sporosarcina sp. G11-34]